MGHMVLQLIAVAPKAQMFFGTAQMILRTAPDPVIIRMCSCALPHYLGDYFQRFSEWFHPSLSPAQQKLQTLRSRSTREI
jgi:hypothetical protein